MVVSFGFDVCGTEYADIEIDDNEVEGMSEEEIVTYAKENYSTEAFNQASKECEYSLNGLDCIVVNDTEHWDI